MKTINCPKYQGRRIVGNGKKSYSPQNYLCKDCGRQFIAESERTYKGTIARFIEAIKRALVCGCGIRDIAIILGVSIGKALKILAESQYDFKLKKKHYDCLEIDELWTFIGSKTNKKWLIHAYERDSGEIVAYVWGDRSAKTAELLREKLEKFGVTYDSIATDDWDAFTKAFCTDNHVIGRQHTVGIERNNCRLCHRIRRILRKSCNFSKKLLNHFKAFDMVVNYLNFNTI